MGNYMPKLKVNHTVGIRLPWTLQSEDNWHKTHRLAGKLWVLGGLILLLEAGLQFALSYVLVLVIPRHCVYPYGVLISIKSEKSLV